MTTTRAALAVAMCLAAGPAALNGVGSAQVSNDLGGRFTQFVKRPPRSFSAQTGLGAPQPPPSQELQLRSDLDTIFADPILARALVGIRVDSLATGQTIYQRDAAKLVVPASNMKLLTMSVAATKLGWTFTFETRLEAAGTIADGVLRGDLVAVGGGDPSIVSQDFGASPTFLAWADALARAGIRRVDGRLIGDDRAFDDEGLGAGWAWDYLADGYAAPTGALSYNENVAIVRVWPGKAAGDPVRIEVSPPGNLLDVANEVKTGDAKSGTSLQLLRLPGSPRLTVRGSLPAGGNLATRSAAIDNPTRFFVEGLRLALADRGITITGGSWDIDDVKDPPTGSGRRVIATRTSPPLSVIGGYFLKPSQNFYGETILKTLGRVAGGAGSAAAGRRVVRETLTGWGIPADAFVMDDGSGLSRYDYVTADTIVSILTRMWKDETMRGPFAALLPVAGHDGTLDTRMKATILDAHVQAKTGTISNVRSLSGYLETTSGERLVFSMIANHFTASSSAIDAVVEKALARLAQR